MGSTVMWEIIRMNTESLMSKTLIFLVGVFSTNNARVVVVANSSVKIFVQ